MSGVRVRGQILNEYSTRSCQGQCGEILTGGDDGFIIMLVEYAELLTGRGKYGVLWASCKLGLTRPRP